MEPSVVEMSWTHLRGETALLVPRAVSAAVILVGFWVASAVAVALVERLGRLRALDPSLTRLLARAGRVTLFAFGVVTALGTLGIDVKALVTGLGLTGFALGFALKDVVANTLAGVLILLYKPFRNGDHVEVAGSTGAVLDIDLRYTTLHVDERTRVLVPNSTLFTNSIRVVSAGRAGGEPPGPGVP
jgi:small conductance mechanosensitive channel